MRGRASFSNPFFASPTSQLILQPFRGFTYVTGTSPTSPVELPIDKAEIILQPFRHFTYVTAHSPTLSSLYLRHSSFSNSSVVLPTSQFILQPFFGLSYVTGSSLTSPGEAPMHISYANCKIFSKYCGRHWQKQGSEWVSQVQFFIPIHCQIPPS